MKKDIYTLDEKENGFTDDWHIVLKNGEYYAEFTDKDEAEKFILQKNGDTLAVKADDLMKLQQDILDIEGLNDLESLAFREFFNKMFVGCEKNIDTVAVKVEDLKYIIKDLERGEFKSVIGSYDLIEREAWHRLKQYLSEAKK